MHRKMVVGCILALSLLAAPAAQAASLSPTQVSAILSLLESFGADQSVITNVSAALDGSATTNASCVNLSNNLTLGSGGSDVTSLQNYLIAQGDLDAQYNTGYYGFITAQAVGKLQISLGIVSSSNDSAYGIVGPRTRAAVACGSVTNSPSATIDQSSLTASTGANGMALVTITGGVSNIGLNQIMIAIKGGASTDTIVTNGRWSEQFGSLLSGIYTVQVIDTDPGTNNGIVLATGTLTIANGTSNLVTFTASPNSGAAPLSTTVYASGLSNAGVFYQLNFGDGQTASTGGFTSVQHTYSAPGTYTATLTDPQGNQLGTQTITVASGSTSATPTADIDQNSLTTNSLTPTISGTATNLSSILLYVTQLSAGFGAQGVVDARVPVVDGAWSYSVPSSDGLTRGTYQVHVQDLTTLAGLATATLIIKQ